MSLHIDDITENHLLPSMDKNIFLSEFDYLVFLWKWDKHSLPIIKVVNVLLESPFIHTAQLYVSL